MTHMRNSADSQNPHKKPGTVECVSNLSMGKAETGEEPELTALLALPNQEAPGSSRDSGSTCMMRIEEGTKFGRLVGRDGLQ